jgi:predicted small secreted protein
MESALALVGCNLQRKRRAADDLASRRVLILSSPAAAGLPRPSPNLNRSLIMKKLSILLAFLAAALLAGCNTMQGAGKDIERGGEKLQQSAKDARDGR